MTKRKQVTPSVRRRKDIIRRLDGHRVEQTYVGSTRSDHKNFANGQLIDEAIKRLTLAKKYYTQRDPDWTESTKSKVITRTTNPNRRVRRAAARFVMPGGSLAGYRSGETIPADGEGINKSYWASGSAPQQLYEAAAFVVAELERMQYSDELELGHYDPVAEREARARTINIDTFASDLPSWDGLVTGTPFRFDAANSTFTANYTNSTTASSFVLSPGDVRVVSEAIPCDSSSQDAQVRGQCGVIGRNTQAQIL